MVSKLKRFNQNNKKFKLKFDCFNNIYHIYIFMILKKSCVEWILEKEKN